MKNNTYQEYGSIYFYEGKGVKLHACRTKGKRGPGGVRGKIKEWSSASRRRMREFMLQHRPAEDFNLYGLSLTIPGGQLPVSDVKRLWKDWSTRAIKEGWCAVWRIEKQGRGQAHWHMMLGVPVWYSFESAELAGGIAWARDDDGLAFDRQLTAGAVGRSWFAALRALGRVEFGEPVAYGTKGGMVSGCDDLSVWPGADRYAVAVQYEGKVEGAWLRYMQDHASKAKRAQIAEGFGRHWGVFGRSRWVAVVPDSVQHLSGPEFFRFLRSYQRLCTPHRKCRDRKKGDCKHLAECSYASLNRGCLGGRIRRGSRGRSVWFSNPDTVRRLSDWAVGSVCDASS